MGERPREFRLSYGHPLANGLVFAGLGRHPNSTHYHDSSLYKNAGTLTAMDPPTDWVWENYLGRWMLAFAGGASGEYVSLPDSTVGAWSQLSLSAWVNKATAASSAFILSRSTTSTYNWGLYQSTTQKFWFFAHGLYTTQTTASSNGWRHVCATYDGAFLRLYVDGILAATPTAQTGLLTTTYPIGLALVYSGINWLGGLSDVLIHNRALSPAEIQQLADPSNVMLSGLILPPKRRIWAAVAVGEEDYIYPIFGGHVHRYGTIGAPVFGGHVSRRV